MPHLPNGDCQKPSCTETAENTYRGANGNSLRLCERHYYDQVTGNVTLTSITRSRGREDGPTLLQKLGLSGGGSGGDPPKGATEKKC